MTNAIVMSLDKAHLLASPTGSVDIAALKGLNVVYRDANDREWKGVVENIDGDFLVIKFDEFPKNIGQGQIVEIEDGND